MPVVVRGTSVSLDSPPVVVAMPQGTRIEVNAIEAATAAWIIAVLGGAMLLEGLEASRLRSAARWSPMLVASTG